MAVSYIDTHNAIYHPYIMRRRGSKNFGGDEAATRRGGPAPRAPRGGGGAEGARRRGVPRPSPHRQWSSPQGRRRERSRAGRGGRAGGRRGARRRREGGGGKEEKRGGVLINFGKFWHNFSFKSALPAPGGAGGAASGPCQGRKAEASLRVARLSLPSRLLPPPPPHLTSGAHL